MIGLEVSCYNICCLFITSTSNIVKYVSVDIVKSFLTFNKDAITKSTQVVVSLGSGTGATEMSGNFPVLCLDKMRRAVYAGIVNLKGNCMGKKYIISFLFCAKAQNW